MKIESLTLKNFRGYQNSTTIEFDKNLTAIVGKNDVGKSTILEALDIFFNDGGGAVKIDKNDVNIKSAANKDFQSQISVCFSDLPSSIIIDQTNSTNLEAERMLNSDKMLEVVKKYKNGGKPSVFIHARHPSNPECSDLLTRKNADLKAIIKNKNIKCDDQRVNSKMRKAIWEHYSDNLELKEVDIDASKEDARIIWDKLSKYMPVYSLFQSDRKNNDDDSEVQDPLKEAVKQIINDESLQQILTSVADSVLERLNEVSNETLEKLRELDPNVAKSLNPIIPTSDKLKWGDVFKGVSISGDDIPINKRGSGVKRLILLSFFRAEAERKTKNGEDHGVIYAIEEPETSQHNNNQRLLINALKTLSEKNESTQIIITTHSPTIVKELEYKNIRLISNTDEEILVQQVSEGVLQYPSLNEVNFLAFGEISEEYHNELYGFLKNQNWFEDYKKGKPTHPYKKPLLNGSCKKELLIVTEYIRNQIHHPENKMNIRYSSEQLKQSICDMREFIQNRVKAEGYSEVVVNID